MTNTGLSSVSEPPRVLPWRKMLADWRAHLVEVQRRKDAGEPPLKTIEEYRAEEHASAVSCGANDSEEEEEGKEEVAVACLQDSWSDDERPKKQPRLTPKDGATKVCAATRTPRPADLPLLLVFRIAEFLCSVACLRSTIISATATC